jgi:hypothetical protein
MIMMTTIQKRLIICATLVGVTVTALAAKSHPIGISVNGSIHYSHNPHDGDKGNVLATSGDTVSWICSGSCSSISIHFDTTSPCQEGTDPSSTGNPATALCTVNDPSILQPYKYKITVNGSYSDDPHVIVDNQVLQPKRPKPKKTH